MASEAQYHLEAAVPEGEWKSLLRDGALQQDCMKDWLRRSVLTTSTDKNGADEEQYKRAIAARKWLLDSENSENVVRFLEEHRKDEDRRRTEELAKEQMQARLNTLSEIVERSERRLRKADAIAQSLEKSHAEPILSGADAPVSAGSMEHKATAQQQCKGPVSGAPAPAPAPIGGEAIEPPIRTTRSSSSKLADKLPEPAEPSIALLSSPLKRSAMGNEPLAPAAVDASGKPCKMLVNSAELPAGWEKVLRTGKDGRQYSVFWGPMGQNGRRLYAESMPQARAGGKVAYEKLTPAQKKKLR